MAEIRKGACPAPECPRTDVSITATNVLRVHAANGKRVSADNPACSGSGQPPAGAGTATPAAPVVQGYVCRIPAGPGGCGQQVALTTNGRARSHLMSDMSTPCPGGSDWPLRVDPAGNRHDTAPGSQPRPAVAPEDLLMDEDEGEPVRQLRLAGAFDPEDPEGPGQVPTALTGELKTAVGDPGTVERQLDVYRSALDFDPRDPEGPGEVPGCTHPDGFPDTADVPDADSQDTVVSVCRLCGTIAPEDLPKLEQANEIKQHLLSATAPDADPFDVTHDFTDEATQTYGVHPGPAGDCRLPGCCTHPHGFEYGDDGNGHSGSFCHVCGTEEPEPQAPDPEPTIEELSRYRVGELAEGVLFTRHQARPPLNSLVFRVQTVTEFCIQATIVSAGAHAGRTGELTNLDEEITCTDLNGRPRSRRTPVGPPTSPDLYPTPSRPARTTSSPSPSPARSSKPPTTPSATRPSASGTATSGEATTSGRPALAATPTPTASKRMTPVADAFSTPKQAMKESDKYDNFGRYKLLHPDTGKPVKWTRATTFAKSVQDTFALSMWSQRMVLKGAATRADIPAAAGTLDVKADKDRMNALVEEAKKAAGDKVAANKGTAMHAYTEDLDRRWVGLEVAARPVPEEFQPSVEAYEQILRAFGLEPVPGLIEFTTAVRQYEIAGTSDRVYLVTRDITFDLNGRSVTLYAGEYVVGDVKSGADLSYGWQEICIQLALYVQGLNTSGVWDWATGRWAKPEVPGKPGVQIKVRTDVGIIPHLPVDRSTTGAPLATLYAVDLDAGWAAAVLCAQVRTWRKSRKLATPLEIADVAEPEAGKAPEGPSSRTVVASRPASLEDKAKAVTSKAEASGVFQEAKAARVSVAELKRLTVLMQEKLKSFVEQGA